MILFGNRLYRIVVRNAATPTDPATGSQVMAVFSCKFGTELVLNYIDETGDNEELNLMGMLFL